MIRVAPYLCTCDQRMNVQYGSCSLFTIHELESDILNEVALRNHYQSPCDYVQPVENTDKSFICNHSVL